MTKKKKTQSRGTGTKRKEQIEVHDNNLLMLACVAALFVIFVLLF